MKQIVLLILIMSFIVSIFGCQSLDVEKNTSNETTSRSLETAESTSSETTSQSLEITESTSSETTSQSLEITESTSSETTSRSSEIIESTSSETEMTMDNTCKLFVNGIDIASGHHVVINSSDCYIRVPLIAIMEALDGVVEWTGETKATIYYKDKTFFMDMTEPYLQEAEGWFNYLMIPPGTRYGYSKPQYNDYYLDWNTMWYFLEYIDVNIRVDYNNLSVYIDSIES